jgi:hypothetical protein
MDAAMFGFLDVADAEAGGTAVCGMDLPIPTPCYSFSQNNYLNGVCVASCNDEEACNYFPGSPDASQCSYPDDCEDCGGDCLNDVNANDICDCFETVGCTDADACNYNADAALDDGSCTYPEEGFNCDGSCSDDDGDGVCLLDEIYGCTDTLAINYHPFITEEDGSCVYETTPQESICLPIDDGLFSTDDLLVILSCFGLPLDEAQQCIEALTD